MKPIMGMLLILLSAIPCYSEDKITDYHVIFAKEVFVNSILTEYANLPQFDERERIQGSAVNAASLALLFLENSPSSKSIPTIAELNMFYLDGALSEEYNCIVIKKSRKILKVLKSLDINNLNNKCIDKTKKLGGDTNKICAPANVIKRNIEQQISAITTGAKCDD